MFQYGAIKKHARPKDKQIRAVGIFERSMYIVAIASPIMTLPQVAKVVIEHKTQGISLLTWGAYTILSGLWLA